MRPVTGCFTGGYSQRGAGHHHRGVAPKKAPAQKIGDIYGRSVECEVLLHFACAFNPIDVVRRFLAKEHVHFFPQVGQATIALHQLLANLLVWAGFD